ncbi:MAG: 3-hydroxyacyl-CoA dehydrogenase family protein [Candidatus Tectomicrobia bacterium]|nr:3-hydroxyacyl-CoA dehydrogenase family protein [Candidatus Tectomicrobia bacterium]
MREIKTVTVLGANGQMGAASGGLFLYSEQIHKVYFLARDKEKAQAGLEQAMNMARSGTLKDRAVVGSYEMLEEAVAQSDFVFEALAEDIALKKTFFERIEKSRREGTIIGTVTSGLSISELARSFTSEETARHFLGTHLYNPPNRLNALEIVPGEKTSEDVIRYVSDFFKQQLHRVIIPVYDKPAFAGNRIGFLMLNRAAQLAEEVGVEQVDFLLSGYTGISTALPLLSTIDLVGLDTHKAIVDNIYRHTHGLHHEGYRLPPYMETIIEEGTLGNKAGQGFYKGERESLDIPQVVKEKKVSYRPVKEVKIEFVEKARQQVHLGEPEEALRILLSTESQEADIARTFLATYLSASFGLVGEVTPESSGITGIDHVMRYGFNWAPPSVIVTALGGTDEAIRLIERARFEVPSFLRQLQKEGKQTLYRGSDIVNFFSAPPRRIVLVHPAGTYR